MNTVGLRKFHCKFDSRKVLIFTIFLIILPTMGSTLIQCLFLAFCCAGQTTLATIETPKFIKTPDTCKKSVPLLILIHSSADHFDLRRTLRDTWTKGHPGTTIVKLLLLNLRTKMLTKLRGPLEENHYIEGSFVSVLK